MRSELFTWCPTLEGTVLEVGKRSVNKSSKSPYPHSFGVDLLAGEDVDLVCDASQLPYEDNSWDHCVCLETLEHVQNWRGVLGEMWRVLRHTLVLTTPTAAKKWHGYPNDYWRWTEDHYRAIFKGQEIVKLEKVWKKGIGIVVRKSGPIDLSIEPERVRR